jgi:Histidine kinase-, DNA gyrase B-, and HSP90-like ATPase
MDARPYSHPKLYIQEKRAQHHLSWTTLLEELVDNCLDAGANRIIISFQNGSVSVEDDGVGCDDLGRMVRAGERQDYATTFSGRFAAGMKDATICLGQEVMIRSTHSGVCRTLTYSYPDMIERDSWDIADPSEVKTNTPSGTFIQVSGLLRTPPKNEDLLNALGWDYSPALRSGLVQIIISRPRLGPRPVPAPPLPVMDPVRRLERTVSPGRDLEIEAGILTQPEQRSMAGVTVAIEKRIITSSRRFGLGNTPTPGLYVFCLLKGKRWSLSKNKTEISSGDVDALTRVISSELAELIEQARSAGEDVALSRVNNILSRIGRQARTIHHRKRKAKRGPVKKPGSGTVTPKNMDRRHTQAAVTQPGDTFDDKDLVPPTEGIHISREQRGETSPLFDMAGPYIVVVNTDHPVYEPYSRAFADWAVPAILYSAARNEIKKLDGWLRLPEIEDKSIDRYSLATSLLLESYFELGGAAPVKQQATA